MPKFVFISTSKAFTYLMMQCVVHVSMCAFVCVGAANIFNLLTSHLSKMLESTQAIHRLTETDKGSFFVMETPCKKLFQFTDLAFHQPTEKCIFRAKSSFDGNKM